MTTTARAVVVEAEPAFRTRRANPYNARLYDAMPKSAVEVRDLAWRRLLTRRVDVVHLHWPSLTFLSSGRPAVVLARLVIFYSLLRIARLRGTRLVWTAHNVASHEQRATPPLRRLHRRLLLRNVDAVIVLSESGVAPVRAAYPELAAVPVHVVPHGHYRDDYDLSITRSVARQHLGLRSDGTVLVSVGQIRPYKLVPELVRAFRAIDRDDLVLVVAGRPASEDLAAEIRSSAGDDRRIELRFGFQSDADLAALLRAGDLVVLTYGAVQNSGSAILALSADRPVLAPALGALPDLRAAVGEDWVALYEGTLTTEDLTLAALWAETPRTAPDLTEFDWTTIAARTLEVYRTTTAARRPARSRVPSTPKPSSYP